MARGWESKSVESQQEALEDRLALKAKTELSDAEIRVQREREALLMSRKRVMNDLETVTHDRYRAQLQAALAHIDRQLEALSASAPA